MGSGVNLDWKLGGVVDPGFQTGVGSPKSSTDVGM